MSEKKEFERGKNGLQCEKLFTRSGVIGERGKSLTAAQIAKLGDDDVAALVAQKVLTILPSAPRPKAADSAEAAKG